MKKIILFAFSLFVGIASNGQFKYFNSSPDFSFSTSGKNDTGLGVADMNNDGWKDIVIANGNDIVRWKVEIYYNNGDGSFPSLPDWSSEDVDYHGHLAVADLDGNGWNDIVTSVYIGPNGFSEPGKLKIYFNNEGVIETIPSFQSIDFYSFSCAIGDADGDGDLDIAAATGEAYYEKFENNMIFINNAGNFTTAPQWLSSDTSCSYDVDFADFDRNGFMDLVFGNELTQSRIYMADGAGNIDTQFDWHSEGNKLSANSLDVGFIDDNIYPDVVISNNDQQYGDGKLKCYLFDESGVPDSSSTAWESNYYRYQSGVYLYDIDNNDTLDLIFGGWWEPLQVSFGTENGFETEPSYTSSTSSVVEAIVFSDLDRSHIDTIVDLINVWQDSASIIYMSKQPVENIIEVQVNGEILASSDYCFVPSKNWISLKENAHQGDVIQVKFEYSRYCDMIVSNWDGTDYIFFNRTDTSSIFVRDISVEPFSVSPNPATNTVSLNMGKHKPQQIEILNMQGEIVQKEIGASKKIDVSTLPEGVYFLRVFVNRRILTQKLIVY